MAQTPHQLVPTPTPKQRHAQAEQFSRSRYGRRACCAADRNKFPVRAPVQLVTIGEGYDITVYRINDAYTFRSPRRMIAAKLLQTECALLPALECRGLPLVVPLPRFAGQPAAYAHPV
jgi:hypothetical protein